MVSRIFLPFLTLLLLVVMALPLTAGAQCARGMKLALEPDPAGTEAYRICGAPAVSVAAGWVAVADDDWVPGASNCLNQLCLFSLETGGLVGQWALSPYGAESNPIASSSPPLSSDFAGLSVLLSGYTFTSMEPLIPRRGVNGKIQFQLEERSYLNFTPKDEDSSELRIEVDEKLVKRYYFSSLTLHCVDPETGHSQPLQRSPGSVDLWGLPELRVVVALASYYGNDLMCSRFQWVVIPWGNKTFDP